jgi:PTH1 family peptidyl-tRNA hydrolase
MKLLVGLGNPGADYARNRHNIGFMAVDAIAAGHGFGPWRGKFQGQVAEGRLDGEKCLLLKPATFMNESGRSVAEAVRFYKLDLGDVIVLHDELDLAPGKVRVKTGGGTAGHNGLKSLTRYLGNDYVRVRIGIGHPGDRAKVHSHVLKDFSRAEQEWVAPLLDAIASAAPHLTHNPAGFMNAVALAAGGEKQMAAAPRDRAKVKRAPSQRDLARNQTGRREAPAGERAKPEPQGPFARLRRLFGAENGKG